MQLKTTYSLLQKLEKDNLSLIYQGNFTNFILGMATNLIKTHFESDKGFGSLRNKLSFLMIESFQNIVRYADSEHSQKSNLSHEFFMTRNFGETFYIITSNMIENEKIDFVKGKMDTINKLDKKGLKDLYVSVLTNRRISKEGGAGLGFIEMVRKTKEKIDFDFMKINEELSFFYFQIKLKSKTAREILPQDELPISQSKEIHKIISDENILLVNRGTFTQESIRPILAMVEDNIKDKRLGEQKLVFHLMVEMIQNISKHAYIEDELRQGIFILGQKDNKYFISTGNFIETDKAKKLNNYLNYLTKLTKEELTTLYRELLRDESIPDNITGGLGLIDVARECYKKLNYEFIEINKDLQFFSFIIDI